MEEGVALDENGDILVTPAMLREAEEKAADRAGRLERAQAAHDAGERAVAALSWIEAPSPRRAPPPPVLVGRRPRERVPLPADASRVDRALDYRWTTAQTHDIRLRGAELAGRATAALSAAGGGGGESSSSSSGWLALSLAMAASGDFAAVAEQLPGDAAPRLGLALQLLERGDEAGAEAAFREAMALPACSADVFNEAAHELLDLLVRQGRLAECIDEALPVLERLDGDRFSNPEECLCSLACVFLARGDNVEDMKRAEAFIDRLGATPFAVLPWVM